jgi:hypothetical protein
LVSVGVYVGALSAPSGDRVEDSDGHVRRSSLA